MKSNEVSEITGISVRTLHHYDAMGLLCPGRNPENGYREYAAEDIDKLQQILFFKECGFPLAKIKELLNRPDFDRAKAFDIQKKYLLHEKKRIDSMLKTLEKSIQNMKGELEMSEKEKFNGFDFTSNPYEEEARRLWGDEKIDQNNAYIAGLSNEEQKAIAKGMDDLFMNLSKVRLESPGSAIAQKAIAEMYHHFNANFGYQYSLEAFAGVGQLYITDERFTKNIDKYGEGLSKFLAEAMAIYTENKK